MNRMKRVLALGLVLVLAFSLCACGAQGKELVGTWKFEMNYTAAMNRELGTILGDEMPTEVPQLVVPVLMTFEDNMVCTLTMDQDVAAASVRAYLDVLVDSLIEFMYKQGEDMGINREDMDAYMQETMGADVKTFCQQTMDDAVDIDAMVEGLDEEFSGAWKVKDNKLYLQKDEKGLSDDVYMEYTVEGDKLTFTAAMGDPMGFEDAIGAFPYGEEDLNLGYPMVFTKVA